MKKKLLVTVATMLLLVPQATSVMSAEINYWFWKDAPDDNTIAELAIKFEAETGIKINLMSDVTYNDYFNFLVNSIAAGTAPCATHLNTIFLGQMIEAGVLEPLDEQIAGWAGADAITPSLWAYVVGPDGKTRYALPNKFLMFYMYYRKDILAAAGVEVPKTQAEFVVAAKALSESNPGRQFAFNHRAGGGGVDQWAAFLVAGGAEFIDNNGTIILNSPQARQANQYYVSTYEWAPPEAINMAAGGQMVQELEAGTTAMVIHHVGTSNTLNLGPDKIGVAPVPSLTGDPENSTYMGISNMNGVLSSCENKSDAFKWISYLSEAEAQLAIAKGLDGYLPVIATVAQDPAFVDSPYFQLSMHIAQKSALSWPPLPGTTRVSAAFSPTLQAALLGKTPADQVVETIANTLAGEQ